MYFKMSPFSYADKIKTPMLMIHGEADNNPGTFPYRAKACIMPLKAMAVPCVLCSCHLKAMVMPPKKYFTHALGAASVAGEICKTAENSLTRLPGWEGFVPNICSLPGIVVSLTLRTSRLYWALFFLCCRYPSAIFTITLYRTGI